MSQLMLIFCSLLAGMALIIFAMRSLSESLQTLFEDVIQWFMNLLSHNPFTMLFVGIFVSFFVQSGTSTSVMAVSYAGSGLLSLTQLSIVLLSSNLAVVPTMFFIPFYGQNMDLLFLSVGVVPQIFSHKQFVKYFGKVVFSIGLLMLSFRIMLFGLSSAEDVARPFFNIFVLSESLQTQFLFAFAIAALIQWCLRSSVALLSLILALFMMNLVSPETTLGWVCGVSLGTSIPNLVHAMKTSRLAVRGSLFHLLIKFLLILPVLFFLSDIINFVVQLSTEIASLFGIHVITNSKVMFVPLAYFLFQFSIVLAGFLLHPLIIPMLSKIVANKQKKENQRLRYLGGTPHLAQSLAIEQAQQEMQKMAAMVETILRLTQDLIEGKVLDTEDSDKILKYENITDRIQIEIKEFLNHVMTSQLTLEQGRKVKFLEKVATELEGIADCCKKTSLCFHELNQDMSPDFHQQMLEYFEKVVQCYEVVFNVLTETARPGENEVESAFKSFSAKAEEMRKSFLHILENLPRTSHNAAESALVIGDMIISIRQMAEHSRVLMEENHQLLKH